jgi:hypothetical protein
MRVTSVVFYVALASAPPVASRAAAQTLSKAAAARTEVIAASFSKSKHVVKERRGKRVEKYKDIRSTPAVRANPAEYSGRYEVEDMGFMVQLSADANGNVTGSGYEPVGGDDNGVRKTFRLVDGKIDGALLTATQVYADGTRQRFAGVFMNRTATDSPTDNGVTAFGLGVTGRKVTMNGLTMDKFFYTKRD